MIFKLPPDQMRKLEKIAHSLGKTKQSFVYEVVSERMKDIQELRQVKKATAEDDLRVGLTHQHNGGLGIAAALPAKNKGPVEEPVSQSSPPVVVNVGNGAPTKANGAPLSELDRAALYVIKGDDFLRDARKRTACDMLRASASTDEEYNVLVAQLEQTIAVKTKTVEENSGVNKLARFAFDKLTTLLRGD